MDGMPIFHYLVYDESGTCMNTTYEVQHLYYFKKNRYH